MDPDLWSAAEALFHQALEQPTTERRTWLDAACGGDDRLRAWVERLLDDDAVSGDLFGRIEADQASVRPDPMLGRQLRVYRLTSRVAVGGMGVVYRGQRTDGLFEQDVAVKLIRAEATTEDALRRFEIERQTLASLNHPNIARLYDGGKTEEGTPYLVMEFIDGLPIDRFCNEHSLSIPDRLRLFADVCRAVHFAHKSLVVHRDLKPGNILIDGDGVPKLLDFGIARLLEGDDKRPEPTHTAARIMTPEYASPEQLRGAAITTSSDVYSLGVVLYQLLTGRKPFRRDSRSPADWERIVAELPPTRPSTAVRRAGEPGSTSTLADPTPEEFAARCGSTPSHLGSRLAGDLDRIVLLALRKEPERRYESAQQFAEDIERHLAGRPVIAREDSIFYRTSKFVARNRVVVASAALATGCLVLGIVAALRGERLAEREAAHVRVEAESFRQIAEFLRDTFYTSGAFADEAQHERLRGRILEQAETARRLYGDQHHLRANLLDSLGRVCLRVDLLDDAETLLREALDIRKAEFGEGSIEVALSLGSLGELHYYAGRFDAAVTELRRAYEIQRTSEPGPHTDVARAANDLAVALRNTGKLDAAQRLHVEALELRRRNGELSLPAAESLNNLAGIHLTRGEFEDAQRLLSQAVATRERILGPSHAMTLQARSNLAVATWWLGDRPTARALLHEAVRGYRALHAEGWDGLGRSLAVLASFSLVEEHLDEAAAALAEAVEVQSARVGKQHLIVAKLLIRLAKVRERQGQDAAAKETWERVLPAYRQRGVPTREAGQAFCEFGRFCLRSNARVSAVSAFREAISCLGADEANRDLLGLAEVELGTALQRAGRLDEAETHLLRGIGYLEGIDEAACTAAREQLEKVQGLRKGQSPEPAKSTSPRR